jgi:starvation-inducible DNA-binding protein
MSSENYMSGQNRVAIAQGLTKVLADTFVLYFKTHGFHWNVEGMHFKQLHDMFGEQYNELWTVTDDIAERIRALDEYAPKSYADILSSKTLNEESGVSNAQSMIKALATDHSLIVETIYPVLRTAEDAGDEATVDLLITRIDAHEKTAWMLNSLLK